MLPLNSVLLRETMPYKLFVSKAVNYRFFSRFGEVAFFLIEDDRIYKVFKNYSAIGSDDTTYSSLIWLIF